MKKILALIAVLAITVMTLCACGGEPCDICGDKGATNEVQAVTEWLLCDDCYSEYLSNLYTNDYDYSYDSYDSYDTYDSYDYDDSYDSYDYGSNSCLDCGASIASDRIYCDTCLGFGTCQDCGISVDSDRLYCDSCLGFGTCQDCGRSISSDRLYCDSCLGL